MELRRLLQTTTRGGLSCKDFFEKMRNLADQLAAAGEPVSDTELIRHILTGLGSDYNSFVVALNTRSEPVKLVDLHGFLLSHESLISSQFSSSSSTSLSSSQNPSAFYSNHKPGPRPPYSRPAYNPRPANPYQQRPSYSYPHQRPSYPNSRPTVPRPNANPGLILPTPPHSAPVNYNPAYNGNFTRPYNPDRSEICQLCSKRGHIAENCWHIADFVPKTNHGPWT